MKKNPSIKALLLLTPFNVLAHPSHGDIAMQVGVNHIASIIGGVVVVLAVALVARLYRRKRSGISIKTDG